MRVRAFLTLRIWSGSGVIDQACAAVERSIGGNLEHGCVATRVIRYQQKTSRGIHDTMARCPSTCRQLIKKREFSRFPVDLKCTDRACRLISEIGRLDTRKQHIFVRMNGQKRGVISFARQFRFAQTPRFVIENRRAILELEINPLMCTADKAVVADVLMIAEGDDYD